MAKLGLIGVCSHYESGGERYEELMKAGVTALSGAGLEVVEAEKSVWDAEDAFQVIGQMKEAGLDALAIMNVTWVTDSLLYLFVQELKVPVVFWAVPYPETFSIGCIQNFGSAMTANGVPFEYVYGMPEDAGVIEKLAKIAKAGEIIRGLTSMRIALVGPRQTWRVAGPQDMSLEEWEFSRTLGPTIVHVEMEEITTRAEKITDEEAEEILKGLSGRIGQVDCTHEVMLWMAKVYQATKGIFASLGLQAMAAETYPFYSGLLNQTASWLADDGLIVDTEGDIAHCLVQKLLNLAAGGGACALGEVGAYNDADGFLTICHEGSTAASLAEDLSRVVANPSGERGSFIGVPYKAAPVVTYMDIQGKAGSYQMMIARGETLPVSHEEWNNAGRKLVLKLKPEGNVTPGSLVRQMIEKGLHHHIVVKDGDYTEIASYVCRYMGIQTVGIC